MPLIGGKPVSKKPQATGAGAAPTGAARPFTQRTTVRKLLRPGGGTGQSAFQFFNANFPYPGTSSIQGSQQ